MANYKNNTPKLVEGFLDKFFGKIATKAADKALKDINKKDPKLGKLLSRAQDIRKDGEAFLNKMDPDERDEYMDDLFAKYGL